MADAITPHEEAVPVEHRLYGSGTRPLLPVLFFHAVRSERLMRLRTERRNRRYSVGADWLSFTSATEPPSEKIASVF